MTTATDVRRAALRLGVAALLTTGLASGVFALAFGDFATPVSAEIGSDPSLNTASNDGCPIMSPDGLSLYMATNRPGGFGGLDIWVARRPDTTSGWGAPAPLPGNINTADNEFCPTPTQGKRLFFVRAPAGTMNGDIWFAQEAPRGRYYAPFRLSSDINSPEQEWSPAYFEDKDGNAYLYFSSTRGGTQDIYASKNFAPAQPVAELNTALDDARPNVRRDGLEIVFDSTRPPNLGGPDVWVARRKSIGEPWSAPQPLANVSSDAADTRASLSWDGTFLLVGSQRAGGEGSTDIYVTTRQRVKG